MAFILLVLAALLCRQQAQVQCTLCFWRDLQHCTDASTIALITNAVQSALVQQYWVVDETLTNYYRPADQSLYSADVLFTSYPDGQTRWALLVNGAAFIGTVVHGRLGELARKRKASYIVYCGLRIAVQ